jgi:hypothetical protein
MDVLTPAATLPYWTPTQWTDAQQSKIDEATAKCVARARRPYLKPCMLMKRALEQGTRELYLTRKLLLLYT